MPVKPFKCRLCGKGYTDVIGGDNAFGKRKGGAACIPCFYAEQMTDQGLTIEQVEGSPELLESFTSVITKAGWTWQDMKDSALLLALDPHGGTATTETR